MKSKEVERLDKATTVQPNVPKNVVNDTSECSDTTVDENYIGLHDPTCIDDYFCLRCGALVHDDVLHIEFHEAIDSYTPLMVARNTLRNEQRKSMGDN